MLKNKEFKKTDRFKGFPPENSLLFSPHADSKSWCGFSTLQIDTVTQKSTRKQNVDELS